MLLVGIASLVVLIFLTVFILKMHFSLGQILGLASLVVVVGLLRRYESSWAIPVLGTDIQPSVWGLVPASMVAFMMHKMQPPSTSPQLALFGLLVVGFVLYSLMIGMVFASNIIGVVEAIRAVMIVVMPIPAAWVMAKCISREFSDFDKFSAIFMVCCGLVLGVLGLAAALAPQLLGGALGWSRDMGETERAFAPLGNDITVGFVMVMAYGLGLCQLLRNRIRVLSAITVATTFGCVLMTLARSILLSLAIVTFLSLLPVMRRMGRFVIIVIVMAILVVPVFYFLSSRYDLSRLTSSGDESMSLRAYSAKGALLEATRHPLGAGPAQVYGWARYGGLDWTPKIIEVAGMPSSLEPHNGYLLLLVEHGLPGLAMYFVCIAIIAKRTCRKLSLYDDSSATVLRCFRAIYLSLAVFTLTNSDMLLAPRFAFLIWLFAFSGLLFRHYLDQAIDHEQLIDLEESSFEQPEYARA